MSLVFSLKCQQMSLILCKHAAQTEKDLYPYVLRLNEGELSNSFEANYAAESKTLGDHLSTKEPSLASPCM